MKIAVINGSPKGKYSITLQTMHYIKKLNPQHKFKTIHVGQKIRALENDFSELFSDYDFYNERSGALKMFKHIRENQIFYKTYFKLLFKQWIWCCCSNTVVRIALNLFFILNLLIQSSLLAL